MMARAALAFACLLAAVGCVRRQPLPVLGEVPAFQLTAENGEPFDSRSLAGHIWVADFIFTNCPGPCPMMTANFARIQNKTDGTPVRLVSFTVDPARDTPEALAAFARRFKAEPARWHFLTGDQARLNELGLNAFHLNSVDGSLQHSTRFALVDGNGRIRGYYSTSELGFVERLLADIRRLEHET